MSRGNRVIVGRGLTAAFIGIVAMLAASVAYATTYTVNTLIDANSTDTSTCSLRDAINAANGFPNNTSSCSAARSGDDTITFGITGQITLSSPLPQIVDSTLAIDGPAAAPGITIDGNKSFGVLSIGLRVVTLNVNDLTIADGNASDFGGGIDNQIGGVLNVTNCTFSSNRAGGSGGAVFNIGTLIVTNSTFYQNTSTPGGGGIFNDGGHVTISNSTFVGNGSISGGGIVSAGGTVDIEGTILAMSTGNNCLIRRTTFRDDGYNIADDAANSCGLNTSGTSQIITPDSKIGLASALADNGGPTETIALSAVTGGAYNFIPAPSCTDANNDPLTTDQRGDTRPVNGTCSAGAYQFQSPIDCSTALASNPNLTALLPVMFFPEYIFGVTDSNGGYNLKITGVTQDKKPTGFPLCPNAFSSATTVYVRTNNEPLQPGPSGLLYSIEFTATDNATGESCHGTVPVCIQDIFHTGQACPAPLDISFDATKCP